jgi:hypothetical protein
MFMQKVNVNEFDLKGYSRALSLRGHDVKKCFHGLYDRFEALTIPR